MLQMKRLTRQTSCRRVVHNKKVRRTVQNAREMNGEVESDAERRLRLMQRAKEVRLKVM